MELNDIIKEYLNPFLKEHGFKKYKSGWVKELEDGVFTIVIQKGRYNTKDAVSWGVRFNVIPKSFQEIKESKLPIDIVRIPNVGIRNLVPFEGMFHDLIGTFYYFDIHLIKSEEVSVEEQGKKVVQLFEEYVIPFSNDINTVADFDIALEKVNAGKRPHENDVAHFFLHCIQSAFPTIPNIKAGVKTYKILKMSPEIIEANMDIFDKLAEKRGKHVSKENLYQHLKIFTVLDDRKAFCEEVNRFADMNADDPECGLHHITEEDYDSFFE